MATVASFRGMQHFARFRGEAGIDRQAKPDGSAENDPPATLYKVLDLARRPGRKVRAPQQKKL